MENLLLSLRAFRVIPLVTVITVFRLVLMRTGVRRSGEGCLLLELIRQIVS